MSGAFAPDLGKLSALRSSVRGHIARRRRWTKALFVISVLSEVGLFGAMLLVFDFDNRFYWFVFLGMSFVYSPLITMSLRSSVMLDRLYHRLLIELKYDGRSTLDDREVAAEDEGVPLSFEVDVSEETRAIFAQKSRWGKWLYVLAGVFEAALFGAMLYAMDFSARLDWFLFFGFLGVYSPLAFSMWRNMITIDRVFYGLVDELKYADGSSVKEA